MEESSSLLWWLWLASTIRIRWSAASKPPTSLLPYNWNYWLCNFLGYFNLASIAIYIMHKKIYKCPISTPILQLCQLFSFLWQLIFMSGTFFITLSISNELPIRPSSVELWFGTYRWTLLCYWCVMESIRVPDIDSRFNFVNCFFFYSQLIFCYGTCYYLLVCRLFNPYVNYSLLSFNNSF